MTYNVFGGTLNPTLLLGYSENKYFWTYIGYWFRDIFLSPKHKFYLNVDKEASAYGGLRPLTPYRQYRVSSQGGAAPWILRWGTKQDSREERAEKNLYPHFSKCGGTSKQISVGGLISLTWQVLRRPCYPTFRDEKVKNLLSPAVNRGDAGLNRFRPALHPGPH